MPRRGGRRWTPSWAQPPLSDAAKRTYPVFRDEFKYVNGVRYTITGSRQCLSSNGTTIYTSLMWSDGKPSCNCPGWATSKTQDKYGNPKDKSCSHSKDVREGDHITIRTLDNGTPVVIHHADDQRTHGGLPTAPDWTLGGPVEAAPKKRKIIL